MFWHVAEVHVSVRGIGTCQNITGTSLEHRCTGAYRYIVVSVSEMRDRLVAQGLTSASWRGP